MRLSRIPLVITACATAAALTVVAPASASALTASSQAGTRSQADAAAAAKPALVYSHLALPGGAWAQVYSDGIAEVYRPAPGSGSAASTSAVDHVQFNFFNTFLLDAGAYIQPGSATSNAFTIGPAGQQLYPFGYQTGQ